MFLLRLRMLLKTAGRNGFQLLFAIWHPATPRAVKLGALLLLGYLISPFDLLPDWLPLLGVADDVAIAALLIPFLLNRLPEQARRDTELSSRSLLGRFAFWR